MNPFWIGLLVVVGLAAVVVYGAVILGAFRSYQKQKKAHDLEMFVRNVEERFLGERVKVD